MTGSYHKMSLKFVIMDRTELIRDLPDGWRSSAASQEKQDLENDEYDMLRALDNLIKE
jgi:hypothetical protein